MELKWAAQRGELPRVAQLLASFVDQVDVVDGRTALMAAAFEGHDAVVSLLLGHKASVDLKDVEGATALILAAENGHAEVVAMLLEAKASVDLPSSDGVTALMCAASGGHDAVVRLLLEAKASVDLQDGYGGTALMFAAHDAHLTVVRMLLGAGASLDVKDNDGDIALVNASISGQGSVVSLLLAYQMWHQNEVRPCFKACLNAPDHHHAPPSDSLSFGDQAGGRGLILPLELPVVEVLRHVQWSARAVSHTFQQELEASRTQLRCRWSTARDASPAQL